MTARKPTIPVVTKQAVKGSGAKNPAAKSPPVKTSVVKTSAVKRPAPTDRVLKAPALKRVLDGQPRAEFGHPAPRPAPRVAPIRPAAEPPTHPLPPVAFLRGADELGVVFEPGDLERLSAFLGLLLRANESFNLTSIVDPDEAWSRHILDALTLVPVLASIEVVEGGVLGVVDVGSGGGVPALPLAIVMPEARFTLVEATGKKAEYLVQTARTLGLKNVRVLHERAERIGQVRDHREQYDAAMARALGHLAVVCELCGPLVRPGGVLIGVKGAKADEELAASAKAMGLLGLRHLETTATPTGRLVLLEKTTRTPRTYPRRDGEPTRVPLGLPRQ